MMGFMDHLERLTSFLRADGLEVTAGTDEGTIGVGTAHRGPRSAPAVVRLDPKRLAEFLTGLGLCEESEEGQEREPVELLGTRLIESLTALHDGTSNLTIEVSLKRGMLGRLGLRERRMTPAAPTPRRGGPYYWSAERPVR